MEVANIIQYTVARLVADAQLKALTNGAVQIYKNKSRKEIQIPGVYWTIVSEIPLESEVRIVVQWDVYANSADAMFQMEARLKALMHSDVPLDFTGIQAWSRLISRHDSTDDEQGVYKVMLDFEYRPIREIRYA